ncbi:PIN domain-containing protein [Spiractinospora alimapuensis]|uniref:type II toxin-antitoxin system VapC family toxin n=1 Tax=Spiractinospora alimapuensis TaxID=2820884 RepID=UPI001F39BB42|nr:PIN domain-containing protein [Spiractinospora alimapuensis]QVQ50004.1 PIN domain-containing protein [Spiractinospora alimapuensis]
MLILDTGVILAAADEADPWHEACVAVIENEPGPLFTSPLVVAEACYLIDRQLGPLAESQFLGSLAEGDIQVSDLTGSDWRRMSALVGTYSALPLGGTDASVVTLAERMRVRRIATLDRRHFHVVKSQTMGYFDLVPRER